MDNSIQDHINFYNITQKVEKHCGLNVDKYGRMIIGDGGFPKIPRPQKEAIMTTNINMEQLQNDAVEIFHQGFACSESVIYAIKKNFELDMSDDAIAMSSGFPWGLGGGGCICGALAGATMCIGYFFGRKTPGDPKINRCFALTNELHDYFKETCGGTCCRVLTRGMEKDSPERKAQCTKFVSETVKKTAEIILRELEKDEEK